jgi:hypothetical protein
MGLSGIECETERRVTMTEYTCGPAAITPTVTSWGESVDYGATIRVGDTVKRVAFRDCFGVDVPEERGLVVEDIRVIYYGIPRQWYARITATRAEPYYRCNAAAGVFILDC